MITKLHIPAYPLNQFIDHFFYYTGFDAEYSINRFLPDGNVQMIFDLTDHPKYIYDNETLKKIQSCRKVWFSGFRTEPITIPSGKESEMLVVYFRKGKAYPFIEVPMYTLTNYVVDAELVLKNDILDLRDRMQESKTVEEKFQVLEENFTRHFLSCLEINPCLNYSISKIVAAPSKMSVKEIAQKVGYSQKHFIKLFKDQIGVSPKSFLKIIRFQKAVADIEQQKNVDWSSIAFDCGFYDQSHFIADFKKFSGYTPIEYLKLKGDILNYLPIR